MATDGFQPNNSLHKGHKSRKGLMLTLVALIGMAGAAYYLWPRTPANGQGGMGGGMGGFALPVEATPAEKGTVTETLTVVGQVEANQGVALKSEIAGRIAKIEAADGSTIKQGQNIFRLDDSIQLAALAQAEANLSLAENNQNRAERLAQAGASSQQELDSARADLKLARANVQYARAQLSKTRISAPFSGLVGIRQVNVGDYITAGQALVYVTENNRLKVTFRLPERATGRLEVGVPVTIRTEEGTEVTAPISAVDSQIDPSTRTRELQVLLDNDTDALVAGQFVKVTVPIKQAEDAVVVPEQALVPNGNRTFIYVVNAVKGANISSRTEVVTGLRSNGVVEVKQGLQQGQMVVTAGQQKLQAPVMPVNVLSPTQIIVRPAPVENLQDVFANQSTTPSNVSPAAGQTTPQQQPQGNQ